MSVPSRPSPALAGAVLLGGLGLSASALAMTDLAQGYALGAQSAAPPSTDAAAPTAPAQPKSRSADAAGTDKAAEGSCGAHAQHADAAAPDKSAAASAKHDDKAMAEGKCGEGKCGGGG